VASGVHGASFPEIKISEQLIPIFMQISDSNSKDLYLEEISKIMTVEKAWLGRAVLQKQTAKSAPSVSMINTSKLKTRFYSDRKPKIFPKNGV